MRGFIRTNIVFCAISVVFIHILTPQKILANPLLTPVTLAEGFKLVRKAVNFYKNNPVPPLEFLEDAHTHLLLKEQLEIANKIAIERNETEKQKLIIQKEMLETQIKMLKTAQMQLDLAKGVFDYNKQKDDSILRKLNYSFRKDKMIVVVADFSDGHNSQGIQVADEIYANLIELKKKCGIDFEILNGEIKDKVVIRNEQMARDVGLHFPVGTCYAVIWGTISPRTVGMFRPNITFVLKNSEEKAVADSYTIDLESKELPFLKDNEGNMRNKYSELVAFACAAIPNCYASYEFACERVPDFEKLYEYLGVSKEAKVEIDELKEKVRNMRKWPELRKSLNTLQPSSNEKTFEYLTRLTSVEQETGYPKYILNKKDKTVMALITEKSDSSKPVIFKDEKFGNYICFMDTTEITWGSFLHIYNLIALKENNNPFNSYMNFKSVEDFVDLGNNKTPRAGKFVFKESIVDQSEFAVTNITFSGAYTYCVTAGKNLPKKIEFDKAKIGAQLTVNKNQFPRFKVKDDPLDLSHVKCFDLAGNVAEWIDEPLNSENKRTIFESDNYRLAEPTLIEPNVGFRGVVRIPVSK